jgi:hypothetical protein
MSVPPILETSELHRLHEPFIDRQIEPRAFEELLARLPGLIAPAGPGRAPVVAVERFLRPKALRQLGALPFKDGRYVREGPHPVLDPLVALMLDVSRYGITQHPLSEPRHTVKQLRYDPGSASHHTLTPPHHDHADGNATIFMPQVAGKHMFYAGDSMKHAVRLVPNQLVVVGGQYQYIPELGHHGTAWHSVGHENMAPSRQELQDLERVRVLAYYDGEPTSYEGDFMAEPRARLQIAWEPIPSLRERVLAGMAAAIGRRHTPLPGLGSLIH